MVAGDVEAAVTGVRVVKGFGQEDRELARLDDGARGLFGMRMRVVRLHRPLQPGAAGGPGARPGRRARCSAAGWRCAARSRLGTFLAFSTYLAALVAPVRQLAAAAHDRPAGPGRRRAGARDRRPRSRCSQPGPDAGCPTARSASSSTTCRSATRRRPAGAARARPDRRAGRDAGAGRRRRLRQVELVEPAAALLRRQAGAVRVGGARRPRARHLASLRRAHRRGVRGQLPVLRHRRANIAYGRPDATEEEIAPPPAPPRPTASSPRCRTATTPSSASRA